jgi:iron complex outermembrane receptor protein
MGELDPRAYGQEGVGMGDNRQSGGPLAVLIFAFAVIMFRGAQAQSAVPESAASESAANMLQEVVVTAERQKTNLQETPVAVTAFGGDQLETRDVHTLQDLSFAVPTLDMGVSEGQAHPAIRGIGASDIIWGADPRVAFYLDDVYIPRPEEQLGVLFDVDQVQVLNGPQGTLYGRNATGGALLVSTRTPTWSPTGYVNLTGGNSSTIDANGALSGPLTSTLAGRIAFETLDHGGYGTNILTGDPIDNAHQRSGRVSFLWKPLDNFTFLLQGDYHHENDANYAEHFGGLASLASPPTQPTGLVLGGFVPPIDSRNVANTVDPLNNRTIWDLIGTATWQMGSVTLKSISGYVHADLALRSSIDPSSLTLAFLNQIQTSRQASEELQALGDMGRQHWIVGAAYYDEKLAGQDPVGLNLLIFGGPNFDAQGVNQAANEETKSAALYGRYTYDLTSKLSATLGGRYTNEQKFIYNEFGFDLTDPYSISNAIKNQPPFPYYASHAYNAFTPSGVLQYKFTPKVFGYLTVTEGYKSGGFNIGVYQPAFAPEKVWDYEGGIKSTMLNNRLLLDAAAFYYDYSNLQVSIVEGTQAVIQNAATAHIYGGELTVKALPVKSLELELGLAALHSEYLDYTSVDPANPGLGLLNLSGHQLSQAPKIKVNAGAQYSWVVPDGRLTLRGEYSWVDDIYFTPFETRNAWSPAHSLANAFLTYDSDNWTASAFVRNIANKTIVADAYNATTLVGTPVNVNLEPPRTYGVTLGYRF